MPSFWEPPSTANRPVQTIAIGWAVLSGPPPRLCARCQVRNPCLAFVLAAWQPYGVWGGTTPDERTGLRKKAGTAGLADAAMVS